MSKISTKDQLADALKKLLNDNAELLNPEAVGDLGDAIDFLYEEEADADYANSYEES